MVEFANAPMRGRKHTEEWKQKMSERIRGENHPFYGQSLSKEHIRNISKSKSGKNHPNYGKHLSRQTRQRISEKMSGENHPNYGKFGVEHNRSIRLKQIDKTTDKIIKVWDSMMDIERELGIKHGNISKVCQSKRKSAGGFKWECVKA